MKYEGESHCSNNLSFFHVPFLFSWKYQMSFDRTVCDQIRNKMNACHINWQAELQTNCVYLRGEIQSRSIVYFIEPFSACHLLCLSPLYYLSSADLKKRKIAPKLIIIKKRIFISLIQQFHEAAYLADDRQDLLNAINSFLDCSIVLPPSEMGGDELLRSVARFQREMLRKREEQGIKLLTSEPKSFEEKGEHL